MGLEEFIITTVGEIAALIPVFFMIDNEKIGRKKSLVFSFGMLILVYAAIYFVKFVNGTEARNLLAVIGIFLGNFFTRICF